MLASLAEAPLVDPQLVYEPKYDGIRAIVETTRGRARLWSRLGNEKTGQFPEITAALEAWIRRERVGASVLDGEIVAIDARGRPIGFQYLQGRIHEQSGRHTASRTAFIAFDLLREGQADLRSRPLRERRAALERLFIPATSSPLLRIAEHVRGDGRPLFARALASGWEGLIAKDAGSTYESGKRSPAWRKIKIVRAQEFVVGGWTEPRHTRAGFGALILGVYEGPRVGSGGGAKARPAAPVQNGLIYVGHTGTGFTEREIARVMARLRPLETTTCPFRARPKTNERPHWTTPTLVAEVKFTEWTADGRLRHPVYLGLRDDKRPEDVVREPEPRLGRQVGVVGSSPRRSPVEVPVPGRQLPATSHQPPTSDLRSLLDQLVEIERSRRRGWLQLPDGGQLPVGNLDKVFWPKARLTKGDLLRYYVRVAPFILPAVADRPLVMKRFPNGITGRPFFQHRVDRAPAGVRVEPVAAVERRPQLVGGTLQTLLYMAQLAAVSQDPWFSRVQSVDAADFAALDLDPPEGGPFARVLDVARWVRDELEALGIAGVPKTSGASGLHVYIALPPGTPYDAGLLLCQIVATVVARKHPRAATIERSLKARGSRVYIDYLQNALGKTLAAAYSARASAWAGVSTPLTWDEVDRGVRREAFTIATVPERLRETGDLWKALRSGAVVDFSKVVRYADSYALGGR